ncbi:MAG: SWIM zinc finger domain-containing protein [Treponema sp.]|jgi:hypothetical protein|nr:SWIM zinc finger domain-containing protein [Treponema sp.]
MNITEDFIARFTGNPSTVTNGRQLAGKGSFVSLNINKEGDLLFGSCAGSGKTPYACSVDFSDPANPVPRCSCPSRQIPCKHVAGLLFCRLQGKDFTVAEAPADITGKRNKIRQREERKAEKEKAAAEGRNSGEGPQKVPSGAKSRNAAALKKCRVQLEGISLAEKILHNIMLIGLHRMDMKNRELYMDQAKELGNYSIEGIQASLNAVILSAVEAQKGSSGGQDFTETIGNVNYLYALLKKSRSYTEHKAAFYGELAAAYQEQAAPGADGEAAETDAAKAFREARLHSSIEEQMGYAWKLTELLEEGLFVKDAEMLQVGFEVIEDNAGRQFIDEGIWLCLTNGRIYRTQNLRPFKALKHIPPDDSRFSLLRIGMLYVYPGDNPPRVRWDACEGRPVSAEDLKKAAASGADDFAGVIKAVKNQIRSPLACKNPVFALKTAGFMTEGDSAGDAGGTVHVCDGKGAGIPLKLTNFGGLIREISREQAEGNTLIVRFDQDMKTDMLRAVPIALITDEQVLRFTY